MAATISDVDAQNHVLPVSNCHGEANLLWFAKFAPWMIARKTRCRMKVKLKRVYEEANKNDGKRILVDRLWPRGLTKVEANVDLWLKEIAPSEALRKWFGHEPSKWEEFKRRYSAELKRNSDQLAFLEREASAHKVTLVYGAKDQEHNGAVVLKELLSDA